MDDLIKQLMDEFDLDEADAQRLVDHVLTFVRDRLPQPFAEQLEALVEESSFALDDASSDTSGLMDMLDGIFGSH